MQNRTEGSRQPAQPNVTTIHGSNEPAVQPCHRSWCDQPADGPANEHVGLRSDISATADRSHFLPTTMGGVQVPSLAAFLNEEDSSSPCPGIAIGINVYIPGDDGRYRDVDTYLTPVEAGLLRDHLDVLLVAVAGMTEVES